MKNGKDIGKENMRLTLLLWMVLCSVSMALMWWCASTKTIVIADAAGEEMPHATEEPFAKPVIQTRDVVLEQRADEYGRFYITLPDDVKAENISMENRYWNGEVRIRVKSGSTDFYENCAIAGDVSVIASAVCERKADGALMRIKMEELLEYRSTIEGKNLVLVFYRPEELYDLIVLLDPAGGGEETGYAETAIPQGTDGKDSSIYEKDVTLQIAGLVQKNLSLEGVKVYLTRAEDATVSEEERLAFLEKTGADIYIRIKINSSEDGSRYGIAGGYNGQYFIPGFGNVQLADILTREVTISTSNRAEGLYAVSEDNLLTRMKIPAAELSVGYFSNLTERELLGQESYREKLAAGIIQAIKKVSETLTGIGVKK